MEVALLAPVLAIMMIGVIELGRYAYDGILISNAAHAGAAYGAQGLTYAACGPTHPCPMEQAAIDDYQNNGQPTGNLTVTSSESCGCDTGGSSLSMGTTLCTTASNGAIDQSIASCNTAGGHWAVMVSVTAQGTFTGMFNYPGIPSPITITKTATMRVSQ